MDTISRENNSMLPVGGVIMGVLALLIGGYAAISISKINKTLAVHEDKLAKIDDLASQVSSASAASDKAEKDIAALQSSTQAAVTQIATDLAGLHEQIKHLEEVHVRPGKHGSVDVVAGPGEYIVRSGDTSKKIAASVGCSRAELLAVNPGVAWNKLHVGQKLKLPEKRQSAAPAADQSAAPAPVSQ